MSLVQDGSDNQALLTQNGDGNSMSAVQTGAGNRLAWTQSGNGLSSPTVYQEGNSAMEITQNKMASGIGVGSGHHDYAFSIWARRWYAGIVETIQEYRRH